MTNGLKRSERLKSEYAQLIIPLIAIVLLILFNLIRDASFFSIKTVVNNVGNTVLSGNIISILSGASKLAIVAIGMTLVTAATGGQDISVGATGAIAGSVFMRVLSSGDSVTVGTIVLAFFACCVVSMLFGAFNGTLIAIFKIQPMIATLILFTAGRSIAYWINGGASPTISSPLVDAIGSFIPGVPIPTPIFIVAICGILFALLFKFTNIGLYTQAVGINERASRLNGINTTGIKLLTLVILGVCVAIAACISVSSLGLINHETIMIEIEMDAILAVAIGGNALSGGKFKMSGSILGAYAIEALSTTLYAMKVHSTAIKAYKAVVIILIVVIGSPIVKNMASQLWARFVSTKVPEMTEGK